MSPIVEHWIEKAENDLRNAAHTLTMGDDCPFDTVCFHAQQGVEKYIKGLLANLSIDFPKSHDVSEISKLLPGHMRISLTEAEQAKISDYAVAGRYPDEGEPITRAEAEEALSIAYRVAKEVRKYLKMAPR